MHFVVATGLLLIHSLAFMLTPAGRSMVATVWGWLKGVFGKIAASTPKGILVVIRKKSRKGDEFDLLLSTHDPETVARLLQGSATPLLKQLPPALGGECPTPPHAPANPEPALPLLPPQLTAPELLDSNESESTKVAAPTSRRWPEIEPVRVLRVEYGPREKSPMYGHPPTVAVFLTENRGRFTFPDGRTEERSWKAGESMLMPAEEHLRENLSDNPLEVVLIELE